MNRIAAAILEALVVGSVAAGFGLAANAAWRDGIEIGKDHLPPRATPVLPGTSPEQVEAEVTQRLHELGYRTVTHDEAAATFDDELYRYEAYVFVDARNEALYKDGHVPGAWHFDPYHPERYLESVVPVCRTAQKVIVDSELAAQHLMAQGVQREAIHVYVGGFVAWQKSGRALERGERGSLTPAEPPRAK
jgi:rhodanese-related sulfurtransferase